MKRYSVSESMCQFYDFTHLLANLWKLLICTKEEQPHRGTKHNIRLGSDGSTFFEPCYLCGIGARVDFPSDCARTCQFEPFPRFSVFSFRRDAYFISTYFAVYNSNGTVKWQQETTTRSR